MFCLVVSLNFIKKKTKKPPQKNAKKILLFKVQDRRIGEWRVYLVSTNVSICLESNGPCELDLKILENAKLPKSVCDFSQGFAIPGKSF